MGHACINACINAYAPPPRVKAFAETDVAAGFGRDEDHAGVATRGIEWQQARLTNRVVHGVDAQEGTAHVLHVTVARSVAVVLLQKKVKQTNKQNTTQSNTQTNKNKQGTVLQQGRGGG